MLTALTPYSPQHDVTGLNWLVSQQAKFTVTLAWPGWDKHCQGVAAALTELQWQALTVEHAQPLQLSAEQAGTCNNCSSGGGNNGNVYRNRGSNRAGGALPTMDMVRWILSDAQSAA